MNKQEFLDSVTNRLNKLRSEIEKEFYFLEEDELKRREGKAWSITECIEHINLVNEQYVKNMKLASHSPILNHSEKTKSTWVGRLLIKVNKPKPGGKIPFPTKALKNFIPQKDRRPQAVFLDFNAILNELLLLALDGEKISLNTRIKTLLPFFTIRYAEGFDVLIAHMERHILQAKKLK